jgi:hypothetical protein
MMAAPAAAPIKKVARCFGVIIFKKLLLLVVNN